MKSDHDPNTAARKNPCLAGLLGPCFGGLGGFYLGVRRGLKSTLPWLFFLLVVLIGTKYRETQIICIGLIQIAFAGLVFYRCRRRNAAIAKNVGGNSPGATQEGRPLWISLFSFVGEVVLTLVFGVCLMMVMYVADLGVVARRYGRIRESLHGGMSIEDTLRQVRERSLVHGIPPPNDKNEIENIYLHGPEKGLYSSIDEPGRSLTEKEAALVLRNHMLPGKDYQIVFTFTPFYGPHWSLAVQFDADGKVKGTLPVRGGTREEHSCARPRRDRAPCEQSGQDADVQRHYCGSLRALAGHRKG